MEEEEEKEEEEEDEEEEEEGVGAGEQKGEEIQRRASACSQRPPVPGFLRRTCAAGGSWTG